MKSRNVELPKFVLSLLFRLFLVALMVGLGYCTVYLLLFVSSVDFAWASDQNGNSLLKQMNIAI
jgi:hypothetical protein